MDVRAFGWHTELDVVGGKAILIRPHHSGSVHAAGFITPDDALTQRIPGQAGDPATLPAKL